MILASAAATSSLPGLDGMMFSIENESSVITSRNPVVAASETVTMDIAKERTHVDLIIGTPFLFLHARRRRHAWRSIPQKREMPRVPRIHLRLGAIRRIPLRVEDIQHTTGKMRQFQTIPAENLKLSDPDAKPGELPVLRNADSRTGLLAILFAGRPEEKAEPFGDLPRIRIRRMLHGKL